MGLNIAEQIKGMTSEQFEKVCVKLLKKMKPEPFKITGTRYVKDGGKDIRGTVDGVPYEIWAECKKHSRALGLDDISKNVVLVISNKIRELFFFSTSNITKEAQRHISIVADKHDIAVAFHYGEKLFEEIEALYKSPDDNSTRTNHEDFTIEYYLTSYKNSEKYTKTDKLILKRDNCFYIDLFLHNNSIKTIKNIIISINSSSHFGIKIISDCLNKHFEIQPFTDKFIQIECEVLNNHHVQSIPVIEIEYSIFNCRKQKKIICGTVDARQIIYFPLIGEKPNKFLLQEIKPLLSSNNETDSYVVEIEGKSGNGKSRMLKEICSIGKEHNYRIIQYDGMKNKDISIIRDLICKLFYIPYNKGDITFSTNNILNILLQRGSDAEFANAIFSFAFQFANDDEVMYCVKQAVLNILIHPLFEEKYMLVFDNIQEFNIELIDTLAFIINGVYNQTSNNIIVLSINTEFIPEQNKEGLIGFSDMLNSYPNDFHRHYTCSELVKDDARSLFFHALNSDNQYFIDKLIEKSGCSPFDIIMLIKYLQEEDIIVWQGMSVWYVSDFVKLDAFISNVPKSSSNILKKRLKKQREKKGNNYWEAFNLVIKGLLYFNGFLPIQFIEDIGIDEEMMENIAHSLFIRYDDNSPTILFFHDNIRRFFYNQKSFCTSITVARQIKGWIEKNEEVCVNDKDSVLYNVYKDLADFKSAKEHGIMAAKNCYSLRNYYEAASIGRQLIFNSNILLSPHERLEIMYIISNSESERVNHERGAELFYDAFRFLHTNADVISLADNEYNKFMHDCVNSQITASRPNVALEILNKFEKSATLDNYYKFILHNRYSVVYLAMGNTKNAHSEIKLAIQFAENMKDDYLLSISYSDIAFINFNSFENKDNVIYYFTQAFEKGAAPNDLNRKAELFQQKALYLCLDNRTDEAFLAVNKSIELCEQIRNSFLFIKANTLKSTICAYCQDYDNAIDLLNKVITKCDETHCIVGKIKAYTNMAAVYLAQNDLRLSREYIDIALNLFRQSNISIVKHKPLFYNYITAFADIKEYDELYKIIARYNDEKVLMYLDYIYKYNINKSSYGILRLNNATFNY